MLRCIWDAVSSKQYVSVGTNTDETIASTASDDVNSEFSNSSDSVFELGSSVSDEQSTTCSDSSSDFESLDSSLYLEEDSTMWLDSSSDSEEETCSDSSSDSEKERFDDDMRHGHKRRFVPSGVEPAVTLKKPKMTRHTTTTHHDTQGNLSVKKRFGASRDTQKVMDGAQSLDDKRSHWNLRHK